MSSIRDGPNPLRPYHVASSTGPASINLAPNASASTAPISAPKAGQGQTARFGLSPSAREVLPDLDYSEYLADGSPSLVELAKSFLDQGLWKYTSVFLAQPFEVAKTILQVQDAGSVTGKQEEPGKTRDREEYDVPSDDSDDESHSYFTATTPATSSSRAIRRQYSSSQSRSPPTPASRRARSSSKQSDHTKALPSTSSITAVLSSLWANEGAWGVWKGTNSTFWHGVLFSTIASFLRSFLCAIFALPDPSSTISSLPSPSSLARLDILSSPSPLLSVLASVSASGIAGIVLAPLDIARTKLLLTPSTHPPRSIVPTLQSLRSWILPVSIAPVTFLHSTIPTLISALSPLVLRSRLGMDPASTPTTYATATFLSQAFELGIRLPIETVLRRGQIDAARSAPSISAPASTKLQPAINPLHTTVEIGPYKGLFGTMYHIIYEEGSRPEKNSGANSLTRSTGTSSTIVKHQARGRRRKGQGPEGLWRGWRVGAWGLLGIWIASLVGGPGGGPGQF